jgi:hypothetical protein
MNGSLPSLAQRDTVQIMGEAGGRAAQRVDATADPGQQHPRQADQPRPTLSLGATDQPGQGGITGIECGSCGGADGPFTRVEGVFPMLMCPSCLADRARGCGPYPDVTDAELRGGLDLLPTWALAQKAAAFSAPSIAPVKAPPVCTATRGVLDGWLTCCWSASPMAR